MATFSKLVLSGSTNGKQINVDSTSTPGTLIHAAAPGTSGLDEVWMYAVNSSGSDVLLTVEWGGTTSPDDLIQVTLSSQSGLFLISPGLVINNGLAIRAFAQTANAINISGYANRIS